MWHLKTLTSKEWEEVEELSSDHRNADTKMLLNAKGATILHGNVLISIQGTSIFVKTLGKITEVPVHINISTNIWRNRQITDVSCLTENVDTSFRISHYSKGKFFSNFYQILIHLVHWYTWDFYVWYSKRRSIFILLKYLILLSSGALHS